MAEPGPDPSARPAARGGMAETGLTLIGIGTGDPRHLTLQAIEAIGAADLILLPLKGRDKADLADLRRRIVTTHAPGHEDRIAAFDLPPRDAGIAPYRDRVEAWHDAIATRWRAAMAGRLPQGGGTVAVLVWGDPSLYDSTLRIARRVAQGWPLRLRVIPGITAIQALCAAHAIPLNDLAAAVTITTGRRLRAQGWPEGADTVVVMLDGDTAFLSLPPQGIRIWWGAFLGMPEQICEAGDLAEAGPRIAARRAAARAAHGWIMDVYLMRRVAG